MVLLLHPSLLNAHLSYTPSLLKSIYPDNELTIVHADGRVAEYKAYVTSGPFTVSLLIYIGAGYPSTTPPTLILESSSLSDATRERLAGELQVLILHACTPATLHHHDRHITTTTTTTDSPFGRRW